MAKETKKNGIEIPPELLGKYLDEPVNGEREDKPEMSALAKKIAQRTGELVLNSFDSAAKENDLPGMGGVPVEDYTKLGVLWLEDVLPADALEKSPKYAFLIVSTGILANNGIAYARNENRKKDNA